MAESFLDDCRLSLRHLRRSPGFALAAAAILSLGIGANAAVFSALNAVLMRPLPVKSPSELVRARGYNPKGQPLLTLITAVPLLDEAPGPLTGYCAWNGNLVVPVEANGDPTQAVVDFMTAGCFDTLGIAPVLGRVYTAAEAPLTSTGAPVALIHHRFWQRLFGGDPAVVGRRIRTEGIEVEVIGVLPPAYGGVDIDGGADLVAPFGSLRPLPAGRPAGAPYVIGRLRPGATLDQARAHLETRWPAVLAATLPPGLSAREREARGSARVRVESMATGFSSLREQYTRPLWLAFGVTAVLLVLVCANLGGLLIARLTAREHELAVRRALGATSWRLLRQLALESLLLAVGGTVAGGALAWVFVDVIEGFLPTGLVGRTVSLAPDLRVLGLTAIGGVLTAGLVSLVPLAAVVRGTNHTTARSDRTVAGTGSWRHKVLLVAQVALCSVLVVGAGLLSRSLAALHGAETGVRAEGVLSVRLMPVPDGYQQFDAASYYPALLDRVAALPAVRSVGYARMFPHLTTAVPQLAEVTVEGEPDRGAGAQFDVVSPRFFETVGIRLVRGRGVEVFDDARSRSVAVVNEQLARQLAPEGDIVGRRISYGDDPSRQNIEVVGVVSNATLGSFRATRTPIVYLSAAQTGRLGYYPTLQVATDGNPMRIANRVEQIVRDMGHEYAHTTLPLVEFLGRSAATERLAASVSYATALLGLTLALVGLYALLAYAVARRQRELGIRLAMGATPGSVLRMVIRDGLVLMLAGVAIGIPMSLWPAQALGWLLYGVVPLDPFTLGGTALCFLLLGVVGGLVPARRAARVDPATALRAE